MQHHTLLGMEAVDMAYALHCIVIYLCHGIVFEVVLNFVLKFIRMIFLNISDLSFLSYLYV